MPTKMPSKQMLFAMFIVSVNVFSSVGLIIMIKILFSSYNFNYPGFIVMLHQVTIALVTRVLMYCGVYPNCTVPLFWQITLSLCASLGTVFANVSLRLNTISLYQISKLMNVPMTCAIEWFWFGTTYSSSVKTSLLVLLLGIGLATMTEVHLSFLGLCAGILSSSGTTFYGIFLKEFQKNHSSISVNQLLLTISPSVILWNVPAVFITDDLEALFKYSFTGFAILLLALSCIMAWSVCYTHIVVIEATSPLTLQVVAHCKTIAVFVLGFLVFDTPLVFKNVAGITIAVIGVVLYTWAKSKPQTTLQQQQQQQQQQLCSSSSHSHSYSTTNSSNNTNNNSPSSVSSSSTALAHAHDSSPDISLSVAPLSIR